MFCLVLLHLGGCRGYQRGDMAQGDGTVDEYRRPRILDSLRRLTDEHGTPYCVTYDGWSVGYENDLRKPYRIEVSAEDGTRISWRTHDHGSFVSDRARLYCLEYNPDDSTRQDTRLIAFDLESGQTSWTTALPGVPTPPTSGHTARSRLDVVMRCPPYVVEVRDLWGGWRWHIDRNDGHLVKGPFLPQ